MNAVQAMANTNIGSMIILHENRKVAGAVTGRDLLHRLPAGRPDQDTALLSSIMTTQVRAVRPDDEIADWLRLMSNESLRYLP